MGDLDPYKTVSSRYLCDYVLQVTTESNSERMDAESADFGPAFTALQHAERRAATAPKTACGLVREITHPAVGLRGGGGLFPTQISSGLFP